MNEREALEKAMAWAEKVHAEFQRRTGSGRTHRMRSEFLPELFEILGKGLRENDAGDKRDN